MFLSAVDRSGGIYRHRWGDAPIQTTALNIFCEPSGVVRIPMAYFHGSLNHYFCDGVEEEEYGCEHKNETKLLASLDHGTAKQQGEKRPLPMQVANDIQMRERLASMFPTPKDAFMEHFEIC